MGSDAKDMDGIELDLVASRAADFINGMDSNSTTVSPLFRNQNGDGSARKMQTPTTTPASNSTPRRVSLLERTPSGNELTRRSSTAGDMPSRSKPLAGLSAAEAGGGGGRRENGGVGGGRAGRRRQSLASFGRPNDVLSSLHALPSKGDRGGGGGGGGGSGGVSLKKFMKRASIVDPSRSLLGNLTSMLSKEFVPTSHTSHSQQHGGSGGGDGGGVKAGVGRPPSKVGQGSVTGKANGWKVARKIMLKESPSSPPSGGGNRQEMGKNIKLSPLGTNGVGEDESELQNQGDYPIGVGRHRSNTVETATSSAQEAKVKSTATSEMHILSQQLRLANSTSVELDRMIVQQHERLMRSNSNLSSRRGSANTPGIDIGGKKVLDDTTYLEAADKCSYATKVKLASLCIRDAEIREGFRLRDFSVKGIKRYQVLRSRALAVFTVLVLCGQLFLARLEPSSFRESNFSDPVLRKKYFYRYLTSCVIEIIICCVLLIDVILTVLTMGRQKLKKKLVLFRLLSITLGILDSLVAITGAMCGCFIWIRIIRFIRPLNLFLWSRHLRNALEPLFRSLRKILFVFAVILFIIAVFSSMGLEQFANLDDFRINEEDRAQCNFNFDTAPEAVLSLYVLLTAENFPCVMVPAVRERNLTNANPSQRSGNAIFFVLFTIFGTLFFSNIIVAVVYNSYKKYYRSVVLRRRVRQRRTLLDAFRMLSENAMDEETGQHTRILGRRPWRDVMGVIRPSMPVEKLDFLFDQIDVDASGSIDGVEFLSLTDFLYMTVEEKREHAGLPSAWTRFRAKLEGVLESRGYLRTIIAVICISFIVLCIRCSPTYCPDTAQFLFEYLSYVDVGFAALLALDPLLRLTAQGPGYFRKKLGHMADAICTFLSLAGSVMCLIATERFFAWKASGGGLNYTLYLENSTLPNHAVSESQMQGFDEQDTINWLRTVGVVLRVLRVVRITSALDTLGEVSGRGQFFVMIVLQAAPMFASMLGVILALFYEYSMVGMEFFGDSFKVIIPEWTEFFSFNNWPDSLMLLFQLLTVNSWHIFLLSGMAMYNTYVLKLTAALYFVTFNFLANFVVLTLVLSIVIESVTLLSEEMEERKAEEESDGTSMSSRRPSMKAMDKAAMGATLPEIAEMSEMETDSNGSERHSTGSPPRTPTLQRKNSIEKTDSFKFKITSSPVPPLAKSGSTRFPPGSAAASRQASFVLVPKARSVSTVGSLSGERGSVTPLASLGGSARKVGSLRSLAEESGVDDINSLMPRASLERSREVL